MQCAGQNLRLTFTKGPYGPYAENLRHVLHALEGHMLSGYDDGAAGNPTLKSLSRTVWLTSCLPIWPVVYALSLAYTLAVLFQLSSPSATTDTEPGKSHPVSAIRHRFRSTDPCKPGKTPDCPEALPPVAPVERKSIGRDNFFPGVSPRALLRGWGLGRWRNDGRGQVRQQKLCHPQPSDTPSRLLSSSVSSLNFPLFPLLYFPQHCLNFLPLPQGHGSLRPTRGCAFAALARLFPARKSRLIGAQYSCISST